jgi:hypothetical protein
MYSGIAARESKSGLPLVVRGLLRKEKTGFKPTSIDLVQTYKHRRFRRNFYWDF